MYKKSSILHVIIAAALVVFAPVALFAGHAPTPVADPGGAANIFYGGVNPLHPNAPVLFFVHGLGTNAEYWWTGNDMYQDAYDAGYRTVFISLSADNSKNTASIADNAAMLQQSLPAIQAHFNAGHLYVISHSKGGLDTEAAMMSSSFRAAVKTVFNLATPNQGAELANWAYGKGKLICGLLGILSPGMSDLQTTVVQPLRAQWDPVLSASAIPFYTLTGTGYAAQNNFIYKITGPILTKLTGGELNDGLVATGDVPLPYALSMGEVVDDHIHVAHGSVAWSFMLPNLPSLAGSAAR